ncbi:MAG: glycosyltransferase family 2 protein [Pseudomonadota bacterium]
MRSVIIIPALNEEAAIGGVVRSVRHQVDQVIVVDNGSTDATAGRASEAGADTVHVPQPGYGRACLAGVAASNADLIIFMDGDGADDPNDLSALIEPILSGRVDFVIGSRLLGQTERGALTFTQQFGNRLATGLMRLIWGGEFTDLGPFRAITRSAYDKLDMQAQTYGWTVEMQTRALKQNLRYTEVPVAYRRRIGVSKISGTLKGVLLAGWFILGTIFKEALFNRKTTAREDGVKAESYVALPRSHSK